jgi:hypothetical protein
MEDHNPATDRRALKDPSDALGGLETKLEQSVSHGPSVRHTEIGTVHLHPLSVPNEASDETGWQGQQLRLDGRTIEGDCPSHSTSIANMLSRCQLMKAPNDQAQGSDALGRSIPWSAWLG